MARLGSNEWWLSIAYRSFQLGHMQVVRKGEKRLLRHRWYARCWCGWESESGSAGRADTGGWGHIFDVIQRADKTLNPVIEKWPPGTTPSSSLDELYAALRQRDEPA